MNKNKKIFLILIILEVIVGYMFINSILSKDLISPNNSFTYKYFKIKLSNIINE